MNLFYKLRAKKIPLFRWNELEARLNSRRVSKDVIKYKGQYLKR